MDSDRPADMADQSQQSRFMIGDSNCGVNRHVGKISVRVALSCFVFIDTSYVYLNLVKRVVP